jgi:hypothetical protein
MFRKISLVFFASLLFNCLYAKQVTEQDAKKAGPKSTLGIHEN